MPGAAIDFGAVPPGSPRVLAGRAPEFGMLGYRQRQGLSDIAGAGSATVLPARPDGLTAPIVAATLTLAAVFAVLVRTWLRSRS